MEETTERSPRLLVDFVLDNSASMDGARLGELMGAFRAFEAASAGNAALEVELVSFGGFAPTVVKSFEERGVAPVEAGRFPLLGRTLTFAAERLMTRADALRAAGETLYLPWLILLSDGFTLDATEEAAAMLGAREREGKLMYLPFRLSPRPRCARILPLDRTKRMIGVREGHIQDLFDFLSRMVGERGRLPVDASLQFSKADFEGWAEL